MLASQACQSLTTRLTPRYGASEAASIARIVLEDAFSSRGSTALLSRSLSDIETTQFQAISHRLATGEPLQYVLGAADFFGYKFKVSPAVLIPRQETEELVAWVLGYLKKNYPLLSPGEVAVLDIGTGSGCIAVTLKAKRPALKVWALDISQEAIEIAQINAKQITGDASNICFSKNDITNRGCWPDLPNFQVIVSNPPYIPRQEADLLPEHVLAHEPKLALFVSNDDPLLFYREITAFAKEKLLSGGALFFECNEFNAHQVALLLEKQGFSEISLRQDISGANRMVLGLKN